MGRPQADDASVRQDEFAYNHASKKLKPTMLQTKLRSLPQWLWVLGRWGRACFAHLEWAALYYLAAFCLARWCASFSPFMCTHGAFFLPRGDLGTLSLHEAPLGPRVRACCTWTWTPRAAAAAPTRRAGYYSQCTRSSCCRAGTGYRLVINGATGRGLLCCLLARRCGGGDDCWRD